MKITTWGHFMILDPTLLGMILILLANFVTSAWNRWLIPMLLRAFGACALPGALPCGGAWCACAEAGSRSGGGRSAGGTWGPRSWSCSRTSSEGTWIQVERLVVSNWDDMSICCRAYCYVQNCPSIFLLTILILLFDSCILWYYMCMFQCILALIDEIAKTTGSYYLLLHSYRRAP